MRVSPQLEQGLHARLLRGDETASAELIALYLPYITGALRSALPQQWDEDAYVDAATDALFEYVKRPEIFDPSKARLGTYLVMSARANLLTQIAKNSQLLNK